MITYNIHSDELNIDLIESIKRSYPNKDIVIDIYQNEPLSIEADTITNPEIIKRINDIRNNKNIISPTISV
jgi:hypothetical protein